MYFLLLSLKVISFVLFPQASQPSMNFNISELAICTMASFCYYDQNPSGFCFLVLMRAFVIQTSLGLQNLNMKGKTKRILVVVVK